MTSINCNAPTCTAYPSSPTVNDSQGTVNDEIKQPSSSNNDHRAQLKKRFDIDKHYLEVAANSCIVGNCLVSALVVTLMASKNYNIVHELAKQHGLSYCIGNPYLCRDVWEQKPEPCEAIAIELRKFVTNTIISDIALIEALASYTEYDCLSIKDASAANILLDDQFAQAILNMEKTIEMEKIEPIPPELKTLYMLGDIELQLQKNSLSEKESVYCNNEINQAYQQYKKQNNTLAIDKLYDEIIKKKSSNNKDFNGNDGDTIYYSYECFIMRRMLNQNNAGKPCFLVIDKENLRLSQQELTREEYTVKFYEKYKTVLKAVEQQYLSSEQDVGDIFKRCISNTTGHTIIEVDTIEPETQSPTSECFIVKEPDKKDASANDNAIIYIEISRAGTHAFPALSTKGMEEAIKNETIDYYQELCDEHGSTRFMSFIMHNSPSTNNVAHHIINRYKKDPEKLKKLLYTTNQKKQNSMYLIAQNYNQPLFRKMIHCLKKHPQLFMDIVQQKDHNGNTLQAVFSNHGKMGEFRLMMRVLESGMEFKASKENKTIDYYQELCDEHGSTRFMSFIMQNSPFLNDVAHNVIDRYKMDPEKLKKLLYTTNQKKQNCMHLIAQNYNDRLFKKIIHSLKKYPQLFMDIVQQKDHNGNTLQAVFSNHGKMDEFRLMMTVLESGMEFKARKEKEKAVITNSQ